MDTTLWERYQDPVRNKPLDDGELLHLYKCSQTAGSLARGFNAGEAVRQFYFNIEYGLFNTLRARRIEHLAETLPK